MNPRTNPFESPLTDSVNDREASPPFPAFVCLPTVILLLGGVMLCYGVYWDLQQQSPFEPSHWIRAVFSHETLIAIVSLLAGFTGLFPGKVGWLSIMSGLMLWGSAMINGCVRFEQVPLPAIFVMLFCVVCLTWLRAEKIQKYYGVEELRKGVFYSAMIGLIVVISILDPPW